MIEAIYPWTILNFTLGFVLIYIIGFAVWIWALIDCLQSKATDGDKIIWILIIILFNIFGAIAYLLVSKTDLVNNSIITKQKRNHRLHRIKTGNSLTGVSEGIGHYLEVDVTIIRLLWVGLALITGGLGFIAYILIAIVLPEKKENTTSKKTSKKAVSKKKTTKTTTKKKSKEKEKS
ncbi:MAG: PspC domain-containing protein [Nanobdellota archaeon]